jgi:2-polyprenyl-3-methyl-5-hydroxy-6-metoxy-1,4-benzoquinol methylase
MSESAPYCPLCGGAGRTIYRSTPDRLHGVAGRWDTRRCSACESAWLDPRPAVAEVAGLYPAVYYTHAASRARPASGWRKVISAAWPLPRRRRLIAAGLPYLAAPAGRLLEVGCGSGRNLVGLRDAGWMVVGQDVDPLAVSAARELGLDVRLGPVEQLEGELGRFQVVLISHVIEHLLDPVAMLRLVSQRLDPGGHVVIATPNVNSFLHRALRSRWQPLDVPRHVVLFSELALRSALAAAGFVDIQTQTSSVAAERIAGDSVATALRHTKVPGRVGWLASRFVGVTAQGAAALIRADRRGQGDELRASATIRPGG